MLGMAVSLSVREDLDSMSNSEVTNKTKLLNHDTTGSNYVDCIIIDFEAEMKYPPRLSVSLKSRTAQYAGM